MRWNRIRKLRRPPRQFAGKAYVLLVAGVRGNRGGGRKRKGKRKLVQFLATPMGGGREWDHGATHSGIGVKSTGLLGMGREGEIPLLFSEFYV